MSVSSAAARALGLASLLALAACGAGDKGDPAVVDLDGEEPIGANGDLAPGADRQSAPAPDLMPDPSPEDLEPGGEGALGPTPPEPATEPRSQEPAGAAGS